MSAQALESLKSKEEKGTRMKHQYGARVDLPAQFVTLKLGGETYQVACRSGAPLRFRLGELSLDDTLLSDEVFHNASKGQRASSTRLRAVFGTNDQHAIAERILREGEIQLNIAEKRMLIEPNTTEKKLQENLRKNPHFHAEGDKIYRGSVPTGPTPPRQVTAPARAGRRKSWTSAGVKEGKYFFLEK